MTTPFGGVNPRRAGRAIGSPRPMSLVVGSARTSSYRARKERDIWADLPYEASCFRLDDVLRPGRAPPPHHPAPTASSPRAVAIRRATHGATLRAWQTLDSARPLAGDVLVAAVGGERRPSARDRHGHRGRRPLAPAPTSSRSCTTKHSGSPTRTPRRRLRLVPT